MQGPSKYIPFFNKRTEPIAKNTTTINAPSHSTRISRATTIINSNDYWDKVKLLQEEHKQEIESLTESQDEIFRSTLTDRPKISEVTIISRILTS